MAENENKKLPLKILCIHGYRQNAQMFKEKTGALRKIIKKLAEPVFITAPHRVPPGNMGSAAWSQAQDSHSQLESDGKEDDSSASTVNSENGDSVGERGWWFSREDDYFKSVDYSDCVKGFDESVQLIINTLEAEDGGFDGILGFSQGASLVSVLCSMQKQQGKQWFKFAILVAGFKSRSSPHDVYYSDSDKVDIPTLHVYGDTDRIIVKEMSEHLLQYFHNPKCLCHPGGHFVPASAPQKKVYIEFLNEMANLVDRKL